MQEALTRSYHSQANASVVIIVCIYPGKSEVYHQFISPLFMKGFYTFVAHHVKSKETKIARQTELILTH
jgi:hypothetical protein